MAKKANPGAAGTNETGRRVTERRGLARGEGGESVRATFRTPPQRLFIFWLAA